MAFSVGSTATGKPGQTLSVMAQPTDGSGRVRAVPSVSWSSSNAAVAAVIANGSPVTSVSLLAAGTATVTATVGDLSASLVITVAPSGAASIATYVSRANAAGASAGSAVSGIPGDYFSLRADVRDASGESVPGAVSWSVGDPTVATVIANGLNSTLVQIQGIGTTAVTASDPTGRATATFAVSGALRVADSVVLSNTPANGSGFSAGSSLACEPGDVFSLSAMAFDASSNAIPNPAIVWTNDDPEEVVVYVLPTGATALVQCQGVGTATIAATCGQASATFSVTAATSDVVSIVLSATPAS